MATVEHKILALQKLKRPFNLVMVKTHCGILWALFWWVQTAEQTLACSFAGLQKHAHEKSRNVIRFEAVSDDGKISCLDQWRVERLRGYLSQRMNKIFLHCVRFKKLRGDPGV